MLPEQDERVRRRGEDEEEYEYGVTRREPNMKHEQPGPRAGCFGGAWSVQGRALPPGRYALKSNKFTGVARVH